MRISDDARLIGINIRNMRKKAGLSQIEVSNILNISFQQVQKYETGQNRLPIEKLYVLKHFYGVPYESFFAGFKPLAFL